MPTNPAGKEIVLELLTRFPKAATKTLARKAYAQAPECWTSLETCRTHVRRFRGNQGEANRRDTKDKSHFREPQKPGDPNQFKLPEPLEHFEDWQIRHYDTVGWWLVMSDLHIPYHDVAAITACIQLAKERSVVGILLNGDVADHYSQSFWVTDPRRRDFAKEVSAVRLFNAELRARFPKAVIVWKHGNHEERYESYLKVKAPELLGIADFEYDRVMRCPENGVEVVKDKQPVALGKLLTIHGHEYRAPFQNPVNPARGLFLKAKVSALAGHLHQSSSHSEKDLREHVVTCWSTGCLCNLRPDYSPINKWNHGAALVELSKDGAFQVENFRVLDGVVYR